MTEYRVHLLLLLTRWIGAALIVYVIVYGILWGVRLVVARIASAL